MKNINTKIIFFFVLIFLIIFGFYFKDDIYRLSLRFLNISFEAVETGLENSIEQIGKRVILPSPLKIGGKDTGAVLTKEGIISETNSHREKYGLAALKENEKLNSAALKKAEDMFSRQYFDHISPTGEGPDKIVESAGYEYIIAGENLLLGNFKDDKEAVQAWMDSPPHKENILNNRYSEIGVAVIKGVFEGENVWIGVQEFGLPLSACPEIDSALKRRIDLSQMELDVLSGDIKNKKEEMDNLKKTEEYYKKLEEYNNLVEKYNYRVEQMKKDISEYNSQVNEFNNCVNSG